MSTAVIPEIIQQHAEEAAFLWLLRDQAVRAPHYNLKDLAHLDDRVEAHIDGLRIAGDYGWELCLESLAQKESGEGFTAGVLALESGMTERLEAVLAASESPEIARGIVSACGWVPFEKVSAAVPALLDSAEPRRRRIGVAALAIQRRDPFDALPRALRDEDSEVRARALRAAGEMGRVDQLHRVRHHLKSEDEPCRYFAARSAALLGDRLSAAPVLVELAEAVGFRAEEAAALAVQCMTPPSVELWIRRLASEPATLRLGLIAAGYAGISDFVPSFIEVMQSPPLARLAGEAFSRITGVDIAYQDLDGERPDDFDAGPTENPEDDNVGMDPDEDLPWPGVDAISGWWEAHRGRFQPGTRYFLGEPVGPQSLERGLREGFQRQRIQAALELALEEPERPLFEVRAPGFIQRRLLS